MIEPNKRMHKKLKNCDFIYSDITKLPRNKKFDMIIAIHVFDHVPNFIDFLKPLNQSLNLRDKYMVSYITKIFDG